MTMCHARGFSGLLCAILSIALSHAVEAPRQIMWKDLVPAPAADSPIPKLSKQHALQLQDIAAVRDRRERGEKISAIDAEDEQGALRKLKEAGIDAEDLLSRRKEIMEHRKQRAQSVVADLDGQVVRIPGYLLPLEF